MNEDYTCGCGLYVHPSRINVNAIHIEDCTWYNPKAIHLWNNDKPHRCPNCHCNAVTNEHPQENTVYQCCHCDTRFSSNPGKETRDAGIQCEYYPHEPIMRGK